MTIIGSSIRIPSGQFSVYVTPVDKDGNTQYVTPVDANGNVITGGGGSPGGADTQVQFNDAGSFGGNSGLTYDKTTDALSVTGSVTSTIFRSANSGNVDFVAQPFGTGAFQLQPTDSTATGGNARGASSVDMQRLRAVASYVASGVGSVVIGGRNNAAIGDFSFCGGDNNQTIGTGAFCYATNGSANGQYAVCFSTSGASEGQSSFTCGISATASNFAAFASGVTTFASGRASFAGGSYSSTKNVTNLFALGSDINSTVGKSQSNILSVAAITTDATPTILRSDTNAADATNQLTLQNNSAIAFTAVLVGTITGAGNTTSFQIQGCIKRGANAASTVLVGAITPVLILRDAGAATWAVAVTADTTNGCLAITVTGAAATTIRWTCSIFATEVAF